MHTYIVLLLLFSIVGGCSQALSEGENKMDSPLMQKITSLEKENQNESFKIFGKCSEEITEKFKMTIEETGLEVESTIGDIFTASGTTDQIRKTAKLKFVTQLSLSTKSEMYK